MHEQVVANAITGFARLLTGVRARWRGCAPTPAQRIYFTNHTSHADFVLIWASLPPELRAGTRPVAAADYWEKGPLRRYLINEVFHGVLIDRDPTTRRYDPIDVILAALEAGASLIVFPEGTRSTSGEMLPFKRGIYYIARQRPDVELIPAWIENLSRVLPKGEFLPVPLLCSVTFGAPMHIMAGEDREAFLARLRQAVVDLKQA